MNIFDRGFKSWAERISLAFRTKLNKKPIDPLPARELSEYLHVKLLKPEDIKGLSKENCNYLLQEGSNAWSAVTICIKQNHIVIYNSSHSQRRISSSIMHELSHLILNHKHSKFFHNTKLGLTLRDYDKKQESEADWLSGCLLLPRTALLFINRSNISKEQVLDKYLVSEQLYDFRMKITGVEKYAKRIITYKAN
jgi:hypothetical protein